PPGGSPPGPPSGGPPAGGAPSGDGPEGASPRGGAPSGASAPPGAPPPGEPPRPLPGPPENPEYTPVASQCQISTTAFATAPAAGSSVHSETSCTRRASSIGMPSRSSRTSRRIESTSNQYGPCVSSAVSVHRGAESSMATSLSSTLPDAGAGVEDPLVAASPGSEPHAASTPVSPSSTLIPSARRRVNRAAGDDERGSTPRWWLSGVSGAGTCVSFVSTPPGQAGRSSQ